MARRTASTRLAAVAATTLLMALAACSSGSSPDTSSSGAVVTLAPAASGAPTTAPPSTLPPSVDVGTAALVLGGQLLRFAVTSCALTPAADSSGGTIVLSVAASSADGATLQVTRRSVPVGANTLATTTDTVAYSAGGGLLIAQRFETAGVVHDLRDAAATSSLLSLDGRTVRAAGQFGPQGAIAGDSRIVPGELLLTCGPETTDSTSS